MKTLFRKLGLTTFLIISLFSPGCRGGNDGSSSGGLPVVVTSIFPVGDLVEQLAGDQARVEVLLPSGASPATFDLAPRQIRDLQNGILFVMIGGGLDEWLSRLPADSGGDGPTLRLSDGMNLLAEEDEHGHQGSGNPHIWLDPIVVRDEIVPKLAESLSEVLPDAAEAIFLRAEELADSLTALDEEIRTALIPLEKRAFIATHSAWSYFALRYDLEEAGVIHAHPGQDPSSREMAELAKIAKARGIDCLFIEPQLGEVAARALAAELSLPTFSLDPLGGPYQPDRAGYFELLRFNTAQFLRGLGGGTR
jgi:ABC-type Zn uptake system ZnuABC Zn-binding protein ZnuA